MIGVKASNLDTAGNTPVVWVNDIEPAKIGLFVTPVAFDEGHLQGTLAKSGVAFGSARTADASRFLPKGLHPR